MGGLDKGKRKGKGSPNMTPSSIAGIANWDWWVTIAGVVEVDFLLKSIGVG